MTLKVGTLCYATDSGLGILAKSFFDHGVVTHPIVVRHGKHHTHDEWYPGCPQVTNLRCPRQHNMVRRHLQGLDAVLFFETPFLWNAIDWCRRSGVRTALMPMYECVPEKMPDVPDLLLCPSMLDYEVYYAPKVYRIHPQPFARARGNRHPDTDLLYTPVPVEREWRLRTTAEVFVHNAGHGGLKGRNGTAEFCEALRLVKSPARYVLRMQGPAVNLHLLGGLADRVEIVRETAPYRQLFASGDVFVFPEKFNGLSLPLQEAHASGMCVMATDRFPNNAWLPKEPLIPVAHTRKNRIGPPYNEFDEAVIEPKAIAAKIDEWYGRDISALSLRGKEWAEGNSWARLGPKYKEVLGG